MGMQNMDPAMLRQMLAQQNPMLGQLMSSMTDEQANQMIRSMMNPQKLRAMMALQQQQGSTGNTGMGMPGMLGRPGSSSSYAAPSTGTGGTGTGMDFSSLFSGFAGSGGGGGQQQQQPPHSPPDFSTMMQQMQSMMGGGAPAGAGALGAGPGATTNPWMQQPPSQPQNRPTPNPHHTPQQHPADRYRPQLQSLRDMALIMNNSVCRCCNN